MKKILLLEDDMCLSEIVLEYLIEEGFDTILASDAQEAFELARKEEFDLYIFDVKVPMGDGFSLLKDLRALGKRTPAIFLTSLNSGDDVKEGFESGCDDYVKKPFNLSVLKKHIIDLVIFHKRKRLASVG
ncbi:hypothetical protein DMB95_04260 [Campylobacter sp. MIT 12-8780]|uniref:response regulator transcription factor n=1 Tax=unclassified Campylobacter TaxID=2593542 RepID=UPI00115F6BDA|nr:MULTISPECIES: response regulator [unclassified Campylobacter]NDJ27133.1 response regulator transcription factor [Campylobacter sp. MIT 19-121]TQR41571.1 hypothetical protein DMB95_04260 [Campylobacter sp. MIT 12-8780]